MKTEAWRVVCEDGTIRSVIVEDRGGADEGRYQYTVSGVYLVDRSPRLAVGRWCAMESHALPVVEIVAPGALTAAERVDAERERCATVCRDIARAYLNDINGAGFPRHSGAYSVADGCANAIRSGE